MVCAPAMPICVSILTLSLAGRMPATGCLPSSRRADRRAPAIGSSLLLAGPTSTLLNTRAGNAALRGPLPSPGARVFLRRLHRLLERGVNESTPLQASLVALSVDALLHVFSDDSTNLSEPGQLVRHRPIGHLGRDRSRERKAFEHNRGIEADITREDGVRGPAWPECTSAFLGCRVCPERAGLFKFADEQRPRALRTSRGPSAAAASSIGCLAPTIGSAKHASVDNAPTRKSGPAESDLSRTADMDSRESPRRRPGMPAFSRSVC